MRALRVEEAGCEGMVGQLRNRWTTENGLHWVGDVAWNDDRPNTRKIYLTLATVENLGSTRLATSCRTGLK